MASLTLGLIEALIFGAKNVSIMSTLGKDIVLKTLSLTSSSVIGGISWITSSDNPSFDKVKNQFEKMDLLHSVQVIENLILEQAYVDNLNTSVKKAIIGVNEILIKIDEELRIIQKEMEYHQTKYFKTWRSFNCSLNIKTIQKHHEILIKRYKLLMELLNLYNTGVNKRTIDKDTICYNIKDLLKENEQNI